VCAANHHIRLIYEGSDWNDGENLDFPSQDHSTFSNILKKDVILNCNHFSQYYCFYCMFDQINAALASVRYFFQKHKKKKILQITIFLVV